LKSFGALGLPEKKTCTRSFGRRISIPPPVSADTLAADGGADDELSKVSQPDNMAAATKQATRRENTPAILIN